MDHMPLVSVIMPAYNVENYIEEAIYSVIGQSYANWELLVIDDGSKDRTVEIVRKIAEQDKRISLIQNEKNMGVARTRNRGFELSKGEYVALLDSDDIWHTDKLEKQVKLAKETGADVLCCSYRIVDIDGQKKCNDLIVPEILDLKFLLIENVIGLSTTLLNAEVIKNYQFNPEYYHEDYVLWLQVLQDGKIIRGVKEVLADYRLVPNSRSANKWKSAKNRWLIYRNYLKKPFLECVYLFVNYAFAGFRKYKSF